nr:hypothetical protein [uncultured Mucilaginibacter sp.]
MKKLLILLLAVTSARSFAQTHPTAMPAVIIDSVLVNINYVNYLPPADIVNIDVQRRAEFPNGVIYVTSKDKQKTQNLLKSPLLSLKDIVKANLGAREQSKPIIFLLDGALLTDTANVRIPALAIYSVKVARSDEAPYFKTALPNVLLLKIATKPPVIMIRGESQGNLNGLLQGKLE